jgi:hypothetical protein
MPPADFPVYGLDSPFPGPRWLQLFGDPLDGMPTWVALNHQSADGRSLINVTTHVRRPTGNPRGFKVPTDERAAEQGLSSLEYAALQGTVALINVTLPVLSLARPPGFLKALVARSEDAAGAYADWPTVDWRVDGVHVQAPVWGFAGGWTAFTDAAPGVFLIVVGTGPDTGPEDLSFEALRDASAYHFNLQSSLSFEIANAAAEAAGVPNGSDPSWQRQDWHVDQLQLIRELGHDAPN